MYAWLSVAWLVSREKNNNWRRSKLLRCIHARCVAGKRRVCVSTSLAHMDTTSTHLKTRNTCDIGAITTIQPKESEVYWGRTYWDSSDAFPQISNFENPNAIPLQYDGPFNLLNRRYRYKHRIPCNYMTKCLNSHRMSVLSLAGEWPL